MHQIYKYLNYEHRLFTPHFTQILTNALDKSTFSNRNRTKCCTFKSVLNATVVTVCRSNAPNLYSINKALDSTLYWYPCIGIYKYFQMLWTRVQLSIKMKQNAVYIQFNLCFKCDSCDFVEEMLNYYINIYLHLMGFVVIPHDTS